MSDSNQELELKAASLARLRVRFWRTLINGLVPPAIVVGFVIFAILQIRETEAPLQALANTLGVDASDAQQAVAEVAEQIAGLTEQQQAIEAKLAGAEIPGETATEQVSNLVGEADAIRETVGGKGSLIALSERVEAIVAERQSLDDDLRKVEQSLAALDARASAAEAEAAFAASAEEEAVRARQRAEASLAALRAESAESATRVSALESATRDLTKSLATAEARNRALVASLQAAGEAGEQVKALLRAQAALEGEIDGLRAVQEESAIALADSRIAADAARREAENLARQRDGLQGELAAAQAEIARLSAGAEGGEVAALRAENEALNATLGEARAEAEAAREGQARVEAVLAAIQGDRGEAVAALATLREDNEALRTALEQLQADADSLTADKHAAEAEVEALQRQLAALAARRKPPQGPREDGSLTVYFGFDNSDLTPAARWELAQVALAAKERQAAGITVTGFADSAGKADYNEKLSQRRAVAVANALNQELALLGLPELAVIPVSRGETRLPVATPDGTRNEENRRVEVKLN